MFLSYKIPLVLFLIFSIGDINLPTNASQIIYMERTASQGQSIILDPPTVDSLPSLVPQWFEGHEEGKFLRLSPSDPYYHVTSEGHLIVLDIKDKEDGKVFKVVSSNPTFKDINVVVVYRLLILKEIQNKFEMIFPPKDIFANIHSSSVNFECVANVMPLSSLDTTWYFKSNSRSNEVRIYDNGDKYVISKYNRLLTIKHVTQLDEGIYRCDVTTSLLIGQTSYLSRSARLIFQVALRPHSPHSKINVLKVDSGEPITLPCNFTGKPTPLIKWYHDAQLIEDHSRRIILHDNTLSIKKSSKSDSGYYQCFASNRLGDDFISHFLNVTASMPFIINMSPFENTIITKGNIITLHCNSHGIPKPDITWYQVDHVSNITSIISPASSEVNRIEVVPDVTSTYICEARNDEGQVDRSVRIYAAVPTKISSNHHHGNRSILIGHTIHLTCLVVYDSIYHERTEILWLKDGKHLHALETEFANTSINNDISISGATVRLFDSDESYAEAVEKLRNFVGGIDGLENNLNKDKPLIERPDPGSQLVVSVLDLMVTSVTKEHGGSYECNVVSPGGSGTSLVFVTIRGPPEKPRNVISKLSRFGTPWIIIQWEAGLDNNSPIRRYKLYGLINDNLDPLNSMPPLPEVIDIIESSIQDKVMTYTLRGKPFCSYSFLVSSENDVGEGETSEATDILRVPIQLPSAPPLNVNVLASSEHSILITWQPPPKSEWNGPLLGYTARYKMSEEFRRQVYHSQPRQDINSHSAINILDQKSRELKIGELLPYTPYEVSLAAYNGIGIGPYSLPIIVNTKEGVPKKAPSHVTVVPINSTSVNVTFVLYDLQKFQGFVRGCKIYVELMFEGEKNLSDVAGKKVLDVAIETPSLSYSSYLTSPSHSFLLTELNKFSWYQVGVACYNSKGEGPISNKVKVQTDEDLPGKVASLRLADFTDISFTLEWLPPAEPNGILTNYVLSYKINDKLMSHWLEISQTSYTIGRFEFETAYYIEIAANTRMGVGAVEELTFITPPPPEFPLPASDLIIEEVSSDSVSLVIRRYQTTSVRWLIEVSRGPDRDTFSSLPDDYLSNFLPLNDDDDEGNMTSPSIFSSWILKAESKNKNELETVVSLGGLQPYAVYRLRVYGVNSKGISQKKWLPYYLKTESSKPRPQLWCSSLSYVGPKNGRHVMKWIPLPLHSWQGSQQHSYFNITCFNVPPWHQDCLLFSSNLQILQKIPTNISTYDIKYLSSCPCERFRLSACNDNGCDDGVVMETGKQYEDVTMTTNIIISNITLIPLQPTKMLIMWTHDYDQSRAMCSALKISFWRAHAKGNRIRKFDRNHHNKVTNENLGRSLLSFSLKGSQFKIVSSKDRYTVINDLEPDTLYGFSVQSVDEVVRSLVGDGDYHRGKLATLPIFAATKKDYDFNKPVSLSSSNDWRGRTKSWLLIVVSVIAGMMIIIIITSIYVIFRRIKPKDMKARQTTTSISLNSMTYDPIESTYHSRGHQHLGQKSCWTVKKGKQKSTMFYYGKAPPRPSPGSIQFTNDDNNHKNKSPIKFPDTKYDGDKFQDVTSGYNKDMTTDDDDDAPPLPPPPEVDPYNPDSIFISKPFMSTNRFSTLPTGSCYHVDEFVIDYYPQPMISVYNTSSQNQPVHFNLTSQHLLHHLCTDSSHNPYNMQNPPLQQLWFPRPPEEQAGGVVFNYSPHFGNNQCGSESESETGDMKCMTIGRRYRSSKMAPYI